MNNRELIALARHTLDEDHFAVWIAKHVQGLGRRAGSLALGITEDAYRYRLRQADALIIAAIAVERRENGISGVCSPNPTKDMSDAISSAESLTRKDAA